MSGVSVEEETLIKFFLGPWLIGLSSTYNDKQLVNYWNLYPEDGRGLRLAVVVLGILNVLKSSECLYVLHRRAVVRPLLMGFSASLWIFLIDHFGDIQYDLGLSVTGWWDTANPLMVSYLDFPLWAVSRTWWVVAPIFLLFVFALLAMVIGTYYIKTVQEQQVTDWFAAHLSSVFAGDVILSVTTAYFLIRTKKTVLSRQTAELIRALIPLTFQTAAPAALIAMFNLIFSQMHRTNQPLLGYVEIGFNQVLPKLYAISMMYTLNARRAIRNKVSGSRNGSRTGSSSNDPSLGGRVQPRRVNGDVELGRMEVATQKETTVTDMFATRHSIGDSKVTLEP
ncbi:hypothetical protein MSAN_01890300 [Mycena sanguinolenta]|uniref:DUF6534 domain-containing protein n=1 Tax=Mycena sanguinolenta TaxID=230812 RepID=A0A8H6XRH4_9AGAR|nr:hypothetical protein MSAN_01890300 [Mycena sanguinolenta]